MFTTAFTINIIYIVAYEFGAGIVIGDGAGVESVSDLLVGVRAVAIFVRVEPFGIAGQFVIILVATLAVWVQGEHGFTEVGQLDGEVDVGTGDGADELLFVSVAVSKHVFELGIVAGGNGRRRCYGWVYGDLGEHGLLPFCAVLCVVFVVGGSVSRPRSRGGGVDAGYWWCQCWPQLSWER